VQHPGVDLVAVGVGDLEPAIGARRKRERVLPGRGGMSMPRLGKSGLGYSVSNQLTTASMRSIRS